MPKPTTTTIGRPAALFGAALGFFLSAASPVSADDRRGERDDHRHGKHVVQLPKIGARCANDPKCHNRWHPRSRPWPREVGRRRRLRNARRVRPLAESQLDSGRRRGAESEPRSSADRSAVRRGCRAGDVLAVTLLDIAPDKFGYTIVVPGFGFLRDVFPDPFIVRWDLTRQGATSLDMPGVNIRFDGFMGTIGVAPGPAQTETYSSARPNSPRPAASCCGRSRSMHCPRGLRPRRHHRDRCLRTIPPRENGGNMDVKQMQVGTTLLLPASSTDACCPSATCTSRRATAKCPAPRSRWTRQ